MKCYIKSTKRDVFFDKYIYDGQCHWVSMDEGKIFESVKEARETIKKYKLKNVEIFKKSVYKK